MPFLWWTEAAVATVVVGLRLYTRYLMRGVVAEGWLMLFTLVRSLHAWWHRNKDSRQV